MRRKLLTIAALGVEKEAAKHLMGASRHLGEQGAAPLRMQRIKPGRAGERHAAVLLPLKKIAPGVALSHHAQDAETQEVFIAELRGVAPIPAIVSRQPQGGLEKRFVYGEGGVCGFHAATISTRTSRSDNEYAAASSSGLRRNLRNKPRQVRGLEIGGGGCTEDAHDRDESMAGYDHAFGQSARSQSQGRRLDTPA